MAIKSTIQNKNNKAFLKDNNEIHSNYSQINVKSNTENISAFCSLFNISRPFAQGIFHLGSFALIQNRNKTFDKG